MVESEIVIEVWNHWSNPPNCQYWRIIWIFCPKPIYFVTPLMLYISHRSIGLVRSIRFFLCFEWYAAARVRRQQQEPPRKKINTPEILIKWLLFFVLFDNLFHSCWPVQAGRGLIRRGRDDGCNETGENDQRQFSPLYR